MSPRTEHARTSVGGDPTLTAWWPSKFQWPRQMGGGQQWEQTGDPHPTQTQAHVGRGGCSQLAPQNHPVRQNSVKDTRPSHRHRLKCALCSLPLRLQERSSSQRTPTPVPVTAEPVTTEPVERGVPAPSPPSSHLPLPPAPLPHGSCGLGSSCQVPPAQPPSRFPCADESVL